MVDMVGGSRKVMGDVPKDFSNVMEDVTKGLREKIPYTGDTESLDRCE